MGHADAPGLRIEVAWSPAARQVDQVSLTLPDGSTVADALHACGRWGSDAEIATLAIGIHGRRCTPTQALRDGDRVEVYRPLQLDPKDARRLRHRRQRAGR